MISKKYDLAEFISAYYESFESWSFHNPDPYWTEHYRKELPTWFAGGLEHCGDCLKLPSPCHLCFITEALKMYSLYMFDEKQFKKEYEEFKEVSFDYRRGSLTNENP